MLVKAFVLASAVGSSVALGAGPSQMNYNNSPAPRNAPTPLAVARAQPANQSVTAAPVLAAYGDRDRNRGRDDDDRRGGGGTWGGGRDRDGDRGRRDNDWNRGRGYGYGHDRHDRDDDDRFRFNFGVHIGAPYRPAPVVVKPAPVYYAAPIVRPVDVRPHTLTLRAVQAGDTVMITACGSNVTGGFTTYLDITSTHGGVPTIALRNYGPQACGYVAQCITPFDQRGYFESCTRLCEVFVRVGCETIRVPVEQVGALR